MISRIEINLKKNEKKIKLTDFIFAQYIESLKNIKYQQLIVGVIFSIIFYRNFIY